MHSWISAVALVYTYGVRDPFGIGVIMREIAPRSCRRCSSFFMGSLRLTAICLAGKTVGFTLGSTVKSDRSSLSANGRVEDILVHFKIVVFSVEC